MCEDRLKDSKANIPTGARKNENIALKDRNSNEAADDTSEDKENVKRPEIYKSFDHLTRTEFEAIPKYMKVQADYLLTKTNNNFFHAQMPHEKKYIFSLS